MSVSERAAPAGSIPAAATHAIDDGLPSPQRYFAIAVVLMTYVLVVLDSAIANIALPSIARSLDASAADTVWVVSSYQLAVIVALLPCGALGEKLGARRVFLSGVALFTLASALCAMAPNLPVLVAARFLQGLGGGAIMALGSMMLRFICPHRMLGTIIGINAMTVAISSAAGPGIGGAILAVADWPYLFGVNLPLGLLVLVLFRLLPAPRGQERRFDLVAVAMNGGMFLMFFAGADMLVRHTLTGAALLAGSAVLMVLVIRRERKEAAPLVPVDLFRNPAFRVAAMASVSCFAAQMMSYVALPFYLQHQLHMGITASGFAMIPWPATVAIVAPLAGRLANRVPTALLCAGGGIVLAAGLAVIALTSGAGQMTGFHIGTIMAGAGFGFFQTPNNRILLLSAPRVRAGAAGATQGTARLVGQTIGAIGMSLIFALADPDTAPVIGLFGAAIFALVASAISAMRTRYEQPGAGG